MKNNNIDLINNPYICGLCKEVCSSVNDQYSHFMASHPEFFHRALKVTGRDGSTGNDFHTAFNEIHRATKQILRLTQLQPASWISY